MKIQLYSHQKESEIFENPLSPILNPDAYMYVVLDSVRDVTLCSREKGKKDWNETILYRNGKPSYAVEPRSRNFEPNKIELSPRQEHCIVAEEVGAIVYFTRNRLDITTPERELADVIARTLDEIKQLSPQVEQNQGRIRTLERCLEIAPT